MFNKIIYLLFPLVAASCQMYRTQFDCPPGVGIPCTSVSDIESMIVEKKPWEEGPDYIARCQMPKRLPTCIDAQVIRVWIPQSEDESGCIIEGHYMYFPNNEAD